MCIDYYAWGLKAMTDCKHEFFEVPYTGKIVCRKCGHILSKEEKRDALEYANALRRAEEEADGND